MSSQPEWFTHGPTSQLDTIELRGFDDVEKGMTNGKVVKDVFKMSLGSLCKRYTDNIGIIFSVYRYRKFLIPNIPTTLTSNCRGGTGSKTVFVSVCGNLQHTYQSRSPSLRSSGRKRRLWDNPFQGGF